MCAINLIFAYKDFRVIVSENNADNLAVIPSKNNTKEILIYDNHLNTELVFNDDFTAQDFDLFFTLLHLAKKNVTQKKGKTVYMNFDQLTKFLSAGAYKNKNRFYKKVCAFLNKAKDIRTFFKTDIKNTKGRNAVIEGALFFDKLSVDEATKTASFRLSDGAYEFLFFFEKFMQLNLYEFCSLKRKGSKILFRLLIQFKNLPINKTSRLKELVLNKDEFYKYIKPNKNYTSNDVEKWLLKPAIKELTENNYFKSLICEKIKRNIEISKYKISFDDSNRKE